MASHMRHFVRRICRTVATHGIAIGGAAAIFQLHLGRAEDASAIALTRRLCAVRRNGPLLISDGSTRSSPTCGRTSFRTRWQAPDRKRSMRCASWKRILVLPRNMRLGAWTKLIDECAPGTSHRDMEIRTTSRCSIVLSNEARRVNKIVCVPLISVATLMTCHRDRRRRRRHDGGVRRGGRGAFDAAHRESGSRRRNDFVAGGMVWIPANSKMRAAGIADSLEQARLYLSHVVPGEFKWRSAGDFSLARTRSDRLPRIAHGARVQAGDVLSGLLPRSSRRDARRSCAGARRLRCARARPRFPRCWPRHCPSSRCSAA